MSDSISNGRFSVMTDDDVFVVSASQTDVLLDSENELISALLADEHYQPDLVVFSPIGLFGPSGCGKSTFADLVIDHHLVDGMSDIRMDATDFARSYAIAVDTDSVIEWRTRFLKADLVFIDRLHTIVNKREAQKELIWLINDFIENEKIFVFCSCDTLAELSGLDRALTSRLSSGLIIHINAPGLSARKKFFSLAAEKLGLILEEDALSLLAEKTVGNFTLLYNSLTTLKSFLLIDQRNHSFLVDHDRIVCFLDSLDLEMDQTPSIKSIASSVSRYFGINLSDLRGDSRKKNLVRARGVCVYLCRRLSHLSLDKIGCYLGSRDHTTILNSDRRTELLLATDTQIQNAIQYISDKYSITISALGSKKFSTKGCQPNV